MRSQRILVVDDEPQIRRALDIALRGHGYTVQLAEGSAPALVQKRQTPRLIDENAKPRRGASIQGSKPPG